jgi:hypothetical protein
VLCNSIRASLLALPRDRFRSTNGDRSIDPEMRKEGNARTHALLLISSLDICETEEKDHRHHHLFETYFEVSTDEAKSWHFQEFEDLKYVDLHDLFDCHSLLVYLYDKLVARQHDSKTINYISFSYGARCHILCLLSAPYLKFQGPHLKPEH